MVFRSINRISLLIAGGLMLSSIPGNAQISGTVFRDYNRDGVKQTSAPAEPGVPGVTIKAYTIGDVLLATQTSGASGAYSFPATGTNSVSSGTSVRLEFTLPSSNCFTDSATDYTSYHSTAAGGNGSSVQFVTGGVSATNINFAVVNLDENYTTSNPRMGVLMHSAGDPTGGGTAGNWAAFKLMSYGDIQATASTSTTSALLTKDVRVASTIGATWGLAYSRQAKVFFAAALVRRHMGLGPNGAAGIYKIDTTLGTTTASGFVDLAAVSSSYAAAATSGSYPYPSNGTTLVDGQSASSTIATCAVVGTNTNRGLKVNTSVYTTASAVSTQPYASFDAAAFDQAGKLGLGGLEISTDGRYLYTINLYDKKVYRIDLQNAYSPQTPTSAQITSYSIPTPVGVPSTDMRPWGLKFYRGKLYVGIVNSAQSTGARTDLQAYVYQLDPSGTGTWTQYYSITNLTFTRGKSNASAVTNGTAATGSGDIDSITHWNAWTNNYDKLIRDVSSGNRQLSLPQPILSDIEFDEQGGMILGFMDRTGIQVGYRDWSPYDYGDDGSALGYQRALCSGGDIMRVDLTTSCTKALESAGSITNSAGTFTGNATNNQGNGGGEFYSQDNYSTAHEEIILGALLTVPGTGEVMATGFDAATVNGTNAAGVTRFSNTTGQTIKDGSSNAGSDVYDAFSRGVTFAKGNGMGDIEMVGTLPNTEIGDRVWNDANGNGIQEPGEAGVSSVSLELYADFNADGSPDGSVLATTTTNANGQWWFNSSNITDGDPNTVGNQAGLKANSTYLVRVATSQWNTSTGSGSGVVLSGYRLTRSKVVGAGTQGMSDNDASYASASNLVPQISVTTGTEGANRDDLDIGVTTLAMLGDKVWRDDNGDGIQGATEPGVAGVQVDLFDNSGYRAASTQTDAYGNYYFRSLAAGTYTVRITPPANFSITTKNAGGSTTSNDNNFDPTTYTTASVTLAAGEMNLSVDAGLVFSTPSSTASVGNFVFYDADNSGTYNTGDRGLSGVTVQLLDAGSNIVAATKTDGTGAYLFTNVTPAANYKIKVTAPAGMSFTTQDVGTGATGTGGVGESDLDNDIDPTTGISGSFTLTSGQQIVNVDAGLKLNANTKSSIGDFVWYDVNQNGTQDAGEPGIPGVTVALYSNANVLLTTTTTDAYGKYIFNNLSAGGYHVVFTLPGGYTFSTRNVGQSGNTDVETDSDPGTTTGSTANFPLSAGVHRGSIDAGMYIASTSTIGDFVWNDLNGDGLQTTGEPGVAGITATLYNSSTFAVVGTTSTDENGYYRFTGLPLSATTSYYIVFSNLPSNYSFTTRTTGTTTGSDPDAATGKTASILPGNTAVNITDIDAGIRQGAPSGKGSIGDRVFADVNNNGIQDATEEGVADVTVTLKNSTASSTIATTKTDALGYYRFAGLDAGTYTVAFAMPTGYTAATKNAGSATSATNSDGNTPVSSVSITDSVSIATGEDNVTIDMGLVPGATNATLGGTVWYDNAATGVQQGSNIQGVPGIMVTLLDGAGAVYDNNSVAAGTQPYIVTTDASGNYQFVNLPAAAGGTAYSVLFSQLPVGFSFSAQDADGTAGNGTTDSDPNRATGKTTSVTLLQGGSDYTLDAGIITSRAMLGDYVWEDLNGDGLQTTGESGIPGEAVNLYYDANSDGSISGTEATTPVASAITNYAGVYLFTNLTAGKYQVGFSTTTLPNNLSFTTQTTGTSTGSDADQTTGLAPAVTLAQNTIDLTYDAGVRNSNLAIVGDRVFYDFNTNGRQDAAESGVPAVLLTLTNGSGTVIGSAVTDGSGKYLFTNVPAGTGYYLSFSANVASFDGTGTNQGWTTQNAGGGSAADESRAITTAGGTYGQTATFSVSRGDALLNFDAGIKNVSSGTALPVTLISFDATLVEGARTRLDWKVGVEKALARYEVERSVDGISFLHLLTTNAVGTSSYVGWDNTPVTGTNYYRLKMVNTDGSYEYSAIRTVNVSAQTSTRAMAYPNPASSTLTLSTGNAGNMLIRLYDLNGNVVREQNGGGSIDISTLPNGAYHVEVRDKAAQVILAQQVDILH